MSNNIDLKGRFAVVTGGAQGIGRAIVERLLASGAAVAIWDRDAALAKKTAGEVKGRVEVVAVDVTDYASVENARNATVKAFGRIDILVNNAGIGLPMGSLLDVSASALERLYRVNVKSIYHSARHVVPAMRLRGGGTIINVASISGIRPRAGQAWYSSLKAVVLGLTRSMAVELGPDRIRVNAICPVVTPTPLVRRNLTPEREASLVAAIPLGRLGLPADTANVAAYLASREADFVTGTCIEVDGGRAI